MLAVGPSAVMHAPLAIAALNLVRSFREHGTRSNLGKGSLTMARDAKEKLLAGRGAKLPGHVLRIQRRLKIESDFDYFL